MGTVILTLAEGVVVTPELLQRTGEWLSRRGYAVRYVSWAVGSPGSLAATVRAANLR